LWEGLARFFWKPVVSELTRANHANGEHIWSSASESKATVSCSAIRKLAFVTHWRAVLQVPIDATLGHRNA